jgi:hypothetical protein
MNETLDSKLFRAAKYLNDLNPDGRVKTSSNDKGYARILQIETGCTIWLQHLRNDQLTIGLMVTKNAAEKHAAITNRAIKKFEEFAEGQNKIDEFVHAINSGDRRRKYYLEVTNFPSAQIEMLIEKLLDSFADINSRDELTR